MDQQIQSYDRDACSYLDLGADKNYKTKVIIERWDKERLAWLSSGNKKVDPRDGIPYATLPVDHKQKM